ncbi:MAG: alcohol dehydrogenase catalytic domain-containing protein [Acidimicrobiales bacterium]
MPDPIIKEPTDAIIRITELPGCAARTCTSTRCSPCTSEPGDIPSATSRWASWRRSASWVHNLRPGDRVVVPFNISCGSCFMCSRQLFAQCRDHPGA